MNSLTRSHLRPGMTVWIVLKEDQRTGKRTRGVIKDILTKSPRHPHGIKVRLENGLVGRVQAVVEE
ncbi:MAG: YwbE family protein [Chloroflexota bacterium]